MSIVGCKKEKSAEERKPPRITAPVPKSPARVEADTAGGVHKAFQSAMNAFNSLDLEGAVSIFSEDHELILADSRKSSLVGRQEMRNLLKKVHVAFPDVHLAPKRILDGGEIWVLEAVITGTHHGEFLGQAGTRKQVGGQFTMFSWVTGGKIVKSFLCGNPLAVIKQMKATQGKAPWRPTLPDRHEMVKASGSLAYIGHSRLATFRSCR
jgi:predicted ester cyclase